MNDKLPECHPLFCIPEINIRNFGLLPTYRHSNSTQNEE